MCLFSQELPELWALSQLFPPVLSKLSFAVSAELVPLVSAVSGLRPGRARQLLAAGIRTPQDLATADPTHLCKQVQYLFFNQAQNLIQAAQVREENGFHLVEVTQVLIVIASFFFFSLRKPFKFWVCLGPLCSVIHADTL